MKRLFVLLLVPQFVFAEPVFKSFRDVAYLAVDSTWEGIKDCGLYRYPAYSPGLPVPQVPADEAVVNRSGRLLAYYYEGYFNHLEFKNPNGGLAHWVTFTRDSISFGTPYSGTVAHANRFQTPGGPGYNFYCRSTLVSYGNFLKCVQARYVDVITSQLCRYPYLTE